MTNISQEFDASGIPSLRPYLNSLLENALAEHVMVKWVKSDRDVIIIDGKSINIQVVTTLINNLARKSHLYIQICQIKVQIRMNILLI